MLYEYDGFNRQIGAQADGMTASYTYNPSGLCVGTTKTIKGSTVSVAYIWDGSNIALELDGSDNAIDKYIYGINLVNSDNHGSYLYDGNGSVTALTNGSGVVTKEYRFDAFGVEIDPDLSDLQPFRYKGAAGYYWDNEVGTYRAPVRNYSPILGRWLQEDTHWWPYNAIFGDNPQDPLGLNIYTPNIHAIRQSTNLYVFCGNNPIMYIDPTGGAYEATAGFAGSMWWLTMVDGPILPFGDIAYGLGVAGTAVYDTVTLINVDNIVRFIAEAPSAIKQTADNIGNWFQKTFGGGGIASPGDPNWNGGFKNFNQLKKYLGDPGKGNVYHHIVEQSQIKNSRAGFDASWIHNVNNVVKISSKLNQDINTFYSSKHATDFVNTGGKIFRDWLNTQSFQQQYEWGLKVLRFYGVDI
jgi:RHS repeat-associated protein